MRLDGPFRVLNTHYNGKIVYMICNRNGLRNSGMYTYSFQRDIADDICNYLNNKWESARVKIWLDKITESGNQTGCDQLGRPVFIHFTQQDFKCLVCNVHYQKANGWQYLNGEDNEMCYCETCVDLK